MYIVFDIGGTSTRVAVSHDGTKIDQVERIATPAQPEAGVAAVQTLAQKLLDTKACQGVVGAIPGILGHEKSSLLFSPNLPKWVGFPVQQRLEALLQCPVRLENDAALSGVAEAGIGAGAGYRIVAYLTISTGVGGARIVNGQLDVALHGFEPGQQIIAEGQTLERLVSGSGVQRRFNQEPQTIKDAAIWNEVTRLLAIGINNVIAHWSPEIVVVGGSMMKSISIEQLRGRVQEIFTLTVPPPPIVVAKLGDQSGLEGARLMTRMV